MHSLLKQLLRIAILCKNKGNDMVVRVQLDMMEAFRTIKTAGNKCAPREIGQNCLHMFEWLANANAIFCGKWNVCSFEFC